MPYDNRQRQEPARSTREGIIEAATSVVPRPWLRGTTIRRVAEDAGVSQETIYKTFGGKAALLKAVYDVSLVGDDEDIPLAGRPEAIAVRDAGALLPRRRLRRVRSSSRTRIDPLLRVLLGARDTDQALAEFARTTEKERHVGSRSTCGTGRKRLAPRRHHGRARDRHRVGPQLAAAPLAAARPRLERRAVHPWLAGLIRNSIFDDDRVD